MSPTTVESRSRSASAPAPASLSPLARRLRQLGVSGRRHVRRRRWTRERAMEVVRTLVYVVPLTLLIWVWAQDQQITEAPRQAVPVRISHADPQRVVTILRSVGGEPITTGGPRAEHFQASVELQGPRVGLSSVVRQLQTDRPEPLFDVRLTGPPAEQTTISLRDYLNEIPELRAAGVSVAAVTPSDLVVRIEPRQQVEARIVPSGLVADELASPPVFDPPVATISGPASAIERLAGPGGEVVVSAELPSDIEPGDHEISVALRLPAGAAREVHLSPERVEATFTRRERRREQLALASVPVRVMTPAAMATLVTAEVAQPVVNNLTIEGPADVIQRLRAGGATEEVLALLELGRADLDRVGQTLQRPVAIRLPQGVTLVGEPPEVEFTIRQIGAQ